MGISRTRIDPLSGEVLDAPVHAWNGAGLLAPEAPHLFEKDGRLGGHTHTVVAESSEGPVALDTGFLVSKLFSPHLHRSGLHQIPPHEKYRSGITGSLYRPRS